MVTALVFTREVDLNGRTYPAGALVPDDAFQPPKERSLRSAGWIRDEDIGDLAARPDSFPKGTTTPDYVIAEARALVDRFRAELETAEAYLQMLLGPAVEDEPEAPAPVFESDETAATAAVADEATAPEPDDSDETETEAEPVAEAAGEDGGGNDEDGDSVEANIAAATRPPAGPDDAVAWMPGMTPA